MNFGDALCDLESTWRRYLEERGHYVHQCGAAGHVVRSRNSNKRRYCWLLLISHCPRRVLARSEQAHIRQWLKQTKARKEATYLVVGFFQEPRRIVVLPASSALKAKYVSSDKGGIAWDD